MSHTDKKSLSVFAAKQQFVRSAAGGLANEKARPAKVEDVLERAPMLDKKQQQQQVEVPAAVEPQKDDEGVDMRAELKWRTERAINQQQNFSRTFVGESGAKTMLHAVMLGDGLGHISSGTEFNVDAERRVWKDIIFSYRAFVSQAAESIRLDAVRNTWLNTALRALDDVESGVTTWLDAVELLQFSEGDAGRKTRRDIYMAYARSKFVPTAQAPEFDPEKVFVFEDMYALRVKAGENIFAYTALITAPTRHFYRVVDLLDLLAGAPISAFTPEQQCLMLNLDRNQSAADELARTFAKFNSVEWCEEAEAEWFYNDVLHAPMGVMDGYVLPNSLIGVKLTAMEHFLIAANLAANVATRSVTSQLLLDYSRMPNSEFKEDEPNESPNPTAKGKNGGRGGGGGDDSDDDEESDDESDKTESKPMSINDILFKTVERNVGRSKTKDTLKPAPYQSPVTILFQDLREGDDRLPAVRDFINEEDALEELIDKVDGMDRLADADLKPTEKQQIYERAASEMYTHLQKRTLEGQQLIHEHTRKQLTAALQKRKVDHNFSEDARKQDDYDAAVISESVAMILDSMLVSSNDEERRRWSSYTKTLPFSSEDEDEDTDKTSVRERVSRHIHAACKARRRMIFETLGEIDPDASDTQVVFSNIADGTPSASDEATKILKRSIARNPPGDAADAKTIPVQSKGRRGASENADESYDTTSNKTVKMLVSTRLLVIGATAIATTLFYFAPTSAGEAGLSILLNLDKKLSSTRKDLAGILNRIKSSETNIKAKEREFMDFIDTLKNITNESDQTQIREMERWFTVFKETRQTMGESFDTVMRIAKRYKQGADVIAEIGGLLDRAREYENRRRINPNGEMPPPSAEQMTLLSKTAQLLNDIKNETLASGNSERDSEEKCNLLRMIIPTQAIVDEVQNKNRRIAADQAARAIGNDSGDSPVIMATPQETINATTTYFESVEELINNADIQKANATSVIAMNPAAGKTDKSIENFARSVGFEPEDKCVTDLKKRFESDITDFRILEKGGKDFGGLEDTSSRYIYHTLEKLYDIIQGGFGFLVGRKKDIETLEKIVNAGNITDIYEKYSMHNAENIERMKELAKERLSKIEGDRLALVGAFKAVRANFNDLLIGKFARMNETFVEMIKQEQVNIQDRERFYDVAITSISQFANVIHMNYIRHMGNILVDHLVRGQGRVPILSNMAKQITMAVKSDTAAKSDPSGAAAQLKQANLSHTVNANVFDADQQNAISHHIVGTENGGMKSNTEQGNEWFSSWYQVVDQLYMSADYAPTITQIDGLANWKPTQPLPEFITDCNEQGYARRNSSNKMEIPVMNSIENVLNVKAGFSVAAYNANALSVSDIYKAENVARRYIACSLAIDIVKETELTTGGAQNRSTNGQAALQTLASLTFLTRTSFFTLQTAMSWWSLWARWRFIFSSARVLSHYASLFSGSLLLSTPYAAKILSEYADDDERKRMGVFTLDKAKKLNQLAGDTFVTTTSAITTSAKPARTNVRRLSGSRSSKSSQPSESSQPSQASAGNILATIVEWASWMIFNISTLIERLAEILIEVIDFIPKNISEAFKTIMSAMAALKNTDRFDTDDARRNAVINGIKDTYQSWVVLTAAIGLKAEAGITWLNRNVIDVLFHDPTPSSEDSTVLPQPLIQGLRVALTAVAGSATAYFTSSDILTLWASVKQNAEFSLSWGVQFLSMLSLIAGGAYIIVTIIKAGLKGAGSGAVLRSVLQMTAAIGMVSYGAVMWPLISTVGYFQVAKFFATLIAPWGIRFFVSFVSRLVLGNQNPDTKDTNLPQMERLVRATAIDTIQTIFASLLGIALFTTILPGDTSTNDDSNPLNIMNQTVTTVLNGVTPIETFKLANKTLLNVTEASQILRQNIGEIGNITLTTAMKNAADNLNQIIETQLNLNK